MAVLSLSSIPSWLCISWIIPWFAGVLCRGHLGTHCRVGRACGFKGLGVVVKIGGELGLWVWCYGC